jgi:ABC-type Mn2+/Zn2+ transport system ATPase subunit
MPDLIRLRDAAFGYDGRAVVSGIDLALGAGRFLGHVGPNGSGKTTLFRGMLGLLRPLAGTCVRASGTVFGYVPQREALDANDPLSSREVVEMGAGARLTRRRGVARGDRTEAARLLGRVGLADESGTPFAALSGGQRQRVLLARALLARPHVLLLDEPTSGVDRGAEEHILELLAELHRDGLTILLVSHQIPLVRATVEEVLLVSNGRLERGSPRELLAPERVERVFGAGAYG